MMYTVNYTPLLFAAPIPAKTIGAVVLPSEKTVIKFSVLEDAFIAARAVKAAGSHDVYVSNTEDPDTRYLIPHGKEEDLCTTS